MALFVAPNRVQYGLVVAKDVETGEEIFVAMFLLPDGVDIGTKLKYEMLEYEIID